jgi:plastocyanin
MKTQLVTAALAAALVLATAACGQASSSPQESVTVTEGAAEVTVQDNSFDPANLTLPTGGEVTWTWAEGAAEHNVVGEGFRSEVQSEGAFTHRFDQPGTYEYRCTIHGGMDGTVRVES